MGIYLLSEFKKKWTGLSETSLRRKEETIYLNLKDFVNYCNEDKKRKVSDTSEFMQN